MLKLVFGMTFEIWFGLWYKNRKIEVACCNALCLQCRSGTTEEVDEKMELLREILDLMEAGLEIVEVKKKERQEKNKAAKKKLMLQKKGKDLRLRAMQALQGKKVSVCLFVRNTLS